MSERAERAEPRSAAPPAPPVAPVPVTVDPLLRLSGVGLAERIRRREVTSREVVEAHIRRAEQVNPALNAIVHERFDAARAEADAADAKVRAGAPEIAAPFFGVPCTIKECIGITGLRKTAGLVSRRDLVCDEDGTAVARLRAAGAIPLGVTNVSELMMWMETSNRVYGRTNNAYDRRRTAGGSSGGEGAIVGAGASPMGLGADIGGSIRMPAFFNGVFGHKPTGGLVPTTGHYPMAENEARRFNTCGPLCRRAEDLMPFLRVVAGPDGKDGGCRALALGDPEAVDLSRLRIFVVEDNGAIRVSADLRAAQRAAAQYLGACGARVEPLRQERFRHSLEIWSAMMHAAAETPFSHYLGDGRTLRTGVQLLRWAVRRSPHTFPALALAAVENLPGRMPGRMRRAVEHGQALKRELEELLGESGVLLYPPYPSPAPRHHKPLWPPFNWQYTAIFNVLEFPVTVVPLGLNRAGLPLGVQVAGVPGNDHVTIAVALELEERFGGWVPPTAWDA